MSDTLHIKNMVCDRCIAAVKTALEKAEINYTSVTLGQALIEKASAEQLNLLDTGLKEQGFERLQDPEDQTVAQIKALIVQSLQEPDLLQNKNYSTIITLKSFTLVRVGPTMMC